MILDFLRPNSFKFGYPLLNFNIHVTGVSTEPGGAYSSGALGITSILEVHVLTQFCHINVYGLTVTEYR